MHGDRGVGELGPDAVTGYQRDCVGQRNPPRADHSVCGAASVAGVTAVRGDSRGARSNATYALPVRRVRIHEPAVALSDLLLAVETGVCAVALARSAPGSDAPQRARRLHRSLVALFAASAAASLAGAGVHGLSSSKNDPREAGPLAHLAAAIGVAGLSAWRVGAALALQRGLARVLLMPVVALHAAYLTVVVRTSPPFRLALAMYAPSALFLRLALIRCLRDDRERRPAALALAALTVSTGAAVMQLRGVALHPRWFDHNATFHAVQAVAFALLFPAARGLVQAASDSTPGKRPPGSEHLSESPVRGVASTR